VPNIFTVKTQRNAALLVGRNSSDGVTEAAKNPASSQCAIGAKNTGADLGGYGNYTGEALGTSQPAIGKKRLASSVLMTKPFISASIVGHT